MLYIRASYAVNGPRITETIRFRGIIMTASEGSI